MEHQIITRTLVEPRKRSIGDTVTLLKGKEVGMGKLRYPVTATVCHVQQREDGSEIYLVRFTDKKGKTRNTWI